MMDTDSKFMGTSSKIASWEWSYKNGKGATKMGKMDSIYPSIPMGAMKEGSFAFAIALTLKHKNLATTKCFFGKLQTLNNFLLGVNTF